MTRTLSTDSGISLTTNIHCVKNMLDHAEPHLVLVKMAKHTPMPKNKRTSIQWRRIVPFSAKTSPLVEGVTPTATQFQYAKVNTTLKQYGDWSEVTDVIEDTVEDPVLVDAQMAHGENVGRTSEALLFGVVKAGTNVQYADTSDSARTDVNSTISLNGLRAVTRTLNSNKARFVTRVVKAGPNYDTQAVEPGFVAVCHSDCEADIRNLPGFTPAAKYGSMSMIHPMELGMVERVRFVTSADLSPWADGGGAKGSMKSTSGTSADVYPILVFGQDAFGTVSLKGTKTSGINSISLIIRNPGSVDSGDPLAQRGSVGWKMWNANIILNEAWVVRYEVAVTNL